MTLDLCPTSNWQAGIVPSLAEHPLARLDRVGVSVTLSTDDTTVSDITLSEEYLNAVETIGLTVPELWEIDRHALDVAFADEEDLAPLRASFAAWGEGVPELAEHLARGESLEGRGQLGGIGRDRGRLLVGGECLDLGPGRDPGQHQHAARPDRLGRGEVRGDPVADHDRLARLATDGVGRGLQQVRRGLPDRDRHDPGRRLERR